MNAESKKTSLNGTLWAVPLVAPQHGEGSATRNPQEPGDREQAPGLGPAFCMLVCML